MIVPSSTSRFSYLPNSKRLLFSYFMFTSRSKISAFVFFPRDLSRKEGNRHQTSAVGDEEKSSGIHYVPAPNSEQPGLGVMQEQNPK